ncbi:MAG: hypothetical protein J1E62_09945 [Lachnospiraceae bacterium]|nr:hypothetical protein [Lachnospiraceae bacterium]
MKKYIVYISVAVISFCIMLLCIALTTALGSELIGTSIPKWLCIIFALMFGGLTIFFSTKVVYLSIGSDEEIELEEHDERNIMLRGKAAQTEKLIMIFIEWGVTIVLLCMGYLFSAAVVMSLSVLRNFTFMMLFANYNRKY